MPNDEGVPKRRSRREPLGYSDFGIAIYFDIRHADFVIESRIE
jgi:hypothetical protein